MAVFTTSATLVTSVLITVARCAIVATEVFAVNTTMTADTTPTPPRITLFIFFMSTHPPFSHAKKKRAVLLFSAPVPSFIYL